MSLSPRSPSARPSSKYAGKSANAVAQSRHREKKKSYVTRLDSRRKTTISELSSNNSSSSSSKLEIDLIELAAAPHHHLRRPRARRQFSGRGRRRGRSTDSEPSSSRWVRPSLPLPPPPLPSSLPPPLPPTQPTSPPPPTRTVLSKPGQTLQQNSRSSPPIHHRHLASSQYWNSHPFAAPSFGGSDASPSSTSYSSFVPSHFPPHFHLQQQHQPSLSSMPFLGDGAGSSGEAGGDEDLTSRSLGLATLSEERSTAEFDASGEAAGFVDFASSPESDGYRTGDSTTSNDSFNFFDPQFQTSLFSPLSSPELDTFRPLAPWPLISLGDAANPPPSRFDSSSTPSSSSCLPAFAFSLNQ